MLSRDDIRGCLGCIAVFFLFFLFLPAAGRIILPAVRRAPLAFLAAWACMPLSAFSLRSRALEDLLTAKGYGVARALLLGCALAFSFVFFAECDYLRDTFGRRYLDGYSVAYFEDTDEYGRPELVADPSTEGLSGSAVLYLLQLLFIALLVGVPVATWLLASSSIKRVDQRRSRSNQGMDHDTG